jgi:hypothetical protein
MRNKIKPEYSLVGFIPTEDYMDTLKKLGFEHVATDIRCSYFKHEDGSSLKYSYGRGKILHHIYKFEKHKDLIKKMYDLYHFFKSNRVNPKIYFKKYKPKRYAKYYKSRIGKIRPYILEKGAFLCNFSGNKYFVAAGVHKEYDYYHLTIQSHYKK